GSITGVVAGDVISVTRASSGDPANATVAGSTYSIIGTLVDSASRLANYTITNPNGALTVTKASIVVVNTDRSKVYGVTFTNADYSGSITGVVAGDVITVARASSGDPANATVAGSTYPIIGTLVDSAGRLANYTITNLNGALTVTKASIVVVNTDRSKVYGVTFTNADYSGSITGVVAGDVISVTRASSGDPANATVAGSTYPIIGTLVDPTSRLANYTITNPNGVLTVTKASIVVVNTDRSKVYGVTFTNADYSGSIIGVVAGDVITVARASSGDPANATVVGSNYPIIGTLVDSASRLANYTITNPNGALTVTKASIVVVNTDRSKVYGVTLTNADYSGSITGVVAGDVITVTRASSGDPANATVAGSTYPIIGTLVDSASRLANYTITNLNGALTINAAPANSLVAVGPTTVQYSDQATFTARIVGGAPLVVGGPQAAVSATFKVGTQIMGTANFIVSGLDLVATTTYALIEGVAGQMSPGSKIVTAVINSVDSNFVISNLGPTTSLTITNEDARVDYTGDAMKATDNSSTTYATVQLRANIFDVSVPQTPSDPAYDAYPGDIRNAKVMFVDRDNSNAPISGWIPVTTLLNPSDTKVGTVSFNYLVNLLSADYKFLTVGILVDNGYYIRNNADDNVVVTVYLPVGDFITGGGYIVPAQSIGTLASTSGKKVNFGFNVKFNKTGKNLNGNMNIIFRRMESDGIVHSYQIKANAMQSLGVNASNPEIQTAEYVSKTNLTDITNPLSTISMGGNKYLYVKMTDKGEPGLNDMISFVLVEGTADPTVPSNIIFSSNWVSFKTEQMKLTGGNLKVHSGFNLGTPTARINSEAVTAKQVIELPAEPVPFNVLVYPNPAKYQFTLEVLGESKEKVDVMVYDALGRTIKHIESDAGQMIQFGEELPTGAYFTKVSQGTNQKTVRLVKE
ncbi:T9SS type A sorting domain-containing protein, partial [Flavobacterium cellulosilyticum]